MYDEIPGHLLNDSLIAAESQRWFAREHSGRDSRLVAGRLIEPARQ